MLKKRKLAAWGAVVCLLMLTMSSVTVFAAEETTEYVPKMYASFCSSKSVVRCIVGIIHPQGKKRIAIPHSVIRTCRCKITIT